MTSIIISFKYFIFPSNLVVNEDATYTIALDNNLLNDICGFRVEENYLKLINVLVIEYAEYIKDLDNATVVSNDLLVQKFVRDMLQKGGYDENENLLDFLKYVNVRLDVKFSHRFQLLLKMQLA